VIADVAEELRRLARSRDDALGYFAAMYARVTSSIATSIAQGRFEDGERMERFALTFAGYYTRCHAAEARRPGCWQASFDVAGRDDLLILQHLLIGINAHVNHDLPQATVEVALAIGDLQSVKADFDHINDLLGAMTTDLLRDLDRVSRWANEAGALGGGRIFNFSLERARDQAWSAAQRLFALSEGDRVRDVAELDRLVNVLAYLVTEPKLPANLLVRLARRFEEHDPRLVTAALLGDRSRRRP
jgi:hypothetical protein